MKKALLGCVIAALALPASAGASVVTLDPSGAGSPLTTAQAIVDDPSTIIAATLPERAYGGTGAPSPIGYGDKLAEPDPKELTGFPTFGDRYGILSSGQLNDVASLLTNTEADTTFEFLSQFPDPLTPDRGPGARDYTVLKIAVNVPGGSSCLALDYRFLSEEFPEFVGSKFNDAFVAEIDSSSWSVADGGDITRPNDFAVSPGGKPISINGVGDTAVAATEAEGTYFDAATGLITTKAPITPGTHSIYLSVFDASDQRYDSAVFVDNLRFTSESGATCKPPEGKEIQPPPPATPNTPPPPPSNVFTLGPSVKFKSQGTQATLTVNAPGPGNLTAYSTTAGTAGRPCRSCGQGQAEEEAELQQGQAGQEGQEVQAQVVQAEGAPDPWQRTGERRGARGRHGQAQRDRQGDPQEEGQAGAARHDHVHAGRWQRRESDDVGHLQEAQGRQEVQGAWRAQEALREGEGEGQAGVALPRALPRDAVCGGRRGGSRGRGARRAGSAAGA